MLVQILSVQPLSLWKCFSTVSDQGETRERQQAAENFLRTNKWAKRGDRMVIISDARMGRALIDSIQLRVVK